MHLALSQSMVPGLATGLQGSPFFELTLLVGGDLEDPIPCYVFKVIPPLLAHGIADPVTASLSARGPVVLIDEDADSIFVGQLDRDLASIGLHKIELVAIDRIPWELTYAHCIRP
jgi:hypothetical protein